VGHDLGKKVERGKGAWKCSRGQANQGALRHPKKIPARPFGPQAAEKRTNVTEEADNEKRRNGRKLGGTGAAIRKFHRENAKP